LVQQTEAKLRIAERGTEFVLDISLKDE